MAPRVRYTRGGDVSIAYQVVGEGPHDLVFVPGFVSHLEVWWELPSLARWLEQMASFSRLILLDKRGTGLSDRTGDVVILEEHADDIAAVMDAAGSERATVVGISEGGPVATVFAAMHPQRASSLVLLNTYARILRADDYPEGIPREAIHAFVERGVGHWGDPVMLELFAPSLADDERVREWWSRMLRLGSSPGSFRQLVGLWEGIDVRSVLPSLHVPTLVVHRRDDRLVPVQWGRRLAEEIPNARMVELPGRDHAPLAGFEDVVEEIEEFVTGMRHRHRPERMLATVLFTDIVGSTERAGELGDGRWRELLERHDELARRDVERFRGRYVKSLGDGMLAAFDGPARAIDSATAIRDDARELGLEVRAGLHAGEVELVGGDDLAGMAVHIGARVAGRAGPGEVLVSSTVRDLVVGSDIPFAERGEHALKGVPGDWRLYAVDR